jgi:sortase B
MRRYAPCEFLGCQTSVCLKAVSCYSVKNTPKIRQPVFNNASSYQEFAKQMLEPCQFAEIPEGQIGNLYTLVTCSYEEEDARTVLFAVEIAK